MSYYYRIRTAKYGDWKVHATMVNEENHIYYLYTQKMDWYGLKNLAIEIGQDKINEGARILNDIAWAMIKEKTIYKTGIKYIINNPDTGKMAHAFWLSTETLFDETILYVHYPFDIAIYNWHTNKWCKYNTDTGEWFETIKPVYNEITIDNIIWG